MDAVASEKTILAAFPRTNRETGVKEQIRVESGDFNGRLYTHFRLWYQVKPKGRDDDGWRPSKVGVTVREDELDQLAAAVEEARRIVHAEGRSTKSGSPRAQRTDRPATTPPTRHGSGQQPAGRTPPRGQTPAPVNADGDEEDIPY